MGDRPSHPEEGGRTAPATPEAPFSETMDLLPTSALTSALLRRLHADWEHRRGDRKYPARRDFDPIDLKYILGKLSILDVLREPIRFRFRVHASEAAHYLGYDLTGRTVNDYPMASYRAYVQRMYAAALERGAPAAVVQRGLSIDNRFLRWEGLILPLAADGTRIDMLMIGLDFQRE